LNKFSIILDKHKPKCFKDIDDDEIPSIMESQEIASKSGSTLTTKGWEENKPKNHTCGFYEYCKTPQQECPLNETNEIKVKKIPKTKKNKISLKTKKKEKR